MTDPITLAAALLVGAAFGAAGGWAARRSPAEGSGEGKAVEAERVAAAEAAVRKLAHDLRGALSPALLMAERLERHEEAPVRHAAEMIVKALDRADGLCRDASAAAKRATGKE
jgi:signal transduction histidine kinase